jgi:hypothetical protein
MPRFYAQVEVLVDADSKEQAEEYFSAFIERAANYSWAVEWGWAPSPVKAAFIEVPQNTTLVR